MGIRVNQNVQSLIARRNLETTNGQLTKSLERLSSGLRINRAADDAAGLAISEGLRSQIQSLGQATRNAGDGLSMLQTAEGALQESTNILQRIRVLAVQSANGTNSAGDRANLQLEVDELLSELQRIGSESEFNGTNLLDGSVSDFQLQVGGREGQVINFSIDDFRTTSLGAIAEQTSDRAINAGTGVSVDGGLIINSVDIRKTVASDDTISASSNSSSGIAVAAAINEKFSETGVRATVESTVATGTGAVTAGTLDGTNTFTINGVQIDATVLAADSDGALREAINAVSNTTGVTASLSAGDALVLTADDGRNIAIGAANAAAAAIVLFTDGDTEFGDVTLTSSENFTVGGVDQAAGFLNFATATTVDYATAINTVDISTVEGANDAFARVDSGLEQIAQGRAQMGAVQNRLESSINGLRIQRENLVAAESRIRDVDFAEETAELTRNQILQQAGTAILAQANVLVPQSALSLLG